MTLGASARYVLDASVAAKWFTLHDETDRRKAVALREMHQAGRCTLAVPEFALLEVLNAVRYSARADEGVALRSLSLLERIRLAVVPLDWDLLRKATAIAWGYRVALYDAAYVALAERDGVPLLTADEVMAKKLHGHRLVVRLSDLEIA